VPPVGNEEKPSIWPGGTAVAVAALFLIVLLRVENQTAVIALLALGIAAVVVANWLGWLVPVTRSFGAREDALGPLALVAALVVGAVFHEDHFVLLLLCTVLLYAVATLGLNIQFGYAGVLNFAGASFFGIGAYTAAVLNQHTGVPHLIVLLTGGIMAALIGSLLLLPVLRTRGHYAAVVTIAFALLFKTFLEVNDVLGGPQGLQVRTMKIFGWSFNDNFEIASISFSFYVSYFLLSLTILVLAFVLVRRVERSWIGLNLDALRLDETAASCFGLNVVRWKITAFLLGNFLIGTAGALFGMVGGFVQPNNYTFADSLILVSILLLGGIGNPWGVVIATVLVVIVPEKLQVIQEYRFMLYAALVMIVLLFRPEGLLPRPVRSYFPGWRP
jgi:ABC-type branched-subunit amino acid transport system permease subunit